jgi:hypothetical protein
MARVRGVTLDVFEDFDTIDLGHFQIEQHELGRVFERTCRKRAATEEKVQSFFPVP